MQTVQKNPYCPKFSIENNFKEKIKTLTEKQSR